MRDAEIEVAVWGMFPLPGRKELGGGEPSGAFIRVHRSRFQGGENQREAPGCRIAWEALDEVDPRTHKATDQVIAA